MNRFVIIDGLPYLYANGNVYSVRWDDAGFTVGAEVEKASVPDRNYSELSIKAKCRNLDSIWKSEEEPFEKMTVAELKEYASQKGIDLDGIRSKAAIIETIRQAVN